MGGYDSTREGAKKGSKGLPFLLIQYIFIIIFIPLEM